MFYCTRIKISWTSLIIILDWKLYLVANKLWMSKLGLLGNNKDACRTYNETYDGIWDFLIWN